MMIKEKDMRLNGLVRNERRAGFNVARLLTVAIASSISAEKLAAETPVIEEVMVTAQRKSESLQDVPVAVSAFSSGDLRQLQAADLGDLQNSVPNLTLHVGDASNAVVYIRGVGQVDSLAFADPGVGVYLDDVYLGRAQGAFLDVFDVERVEVLRGPQGTLYGRNTIGGAIKFVSAPPSEQFSVDADVTVGSYQRRELKATISGPIIDDRLLGKISLADLSRDGYADNNFNGEDDGDKDTFAWRGSLLWQPLEDLTVNFSLDSSSDSPDTSRTPSRETAVFGIPANSDPFEVNANFNDLNDLDVNGVGLTVSWDISEHLVFKSITSSRTMDYAAHLDLDATSQSFFGVFVDEEQEQYSQEFQVSYDDGDTVNAVAGIYYFHEEDETESGVFGPAIGLITNSLNDQTNDSYAIYGQLNFQATQALTVIAGLRYTREEKDFARRQELYDATAAFPVTLGDGVLVLTDVDVDDSWSSVSPKLGVQYQLSDDVMTYASVSRGFKSGGFDGRSNDPFQANAYDPEIMTAYEAGIKTQLWDRRLRFNSAIFYNDYEDLQLSSFVAAPDGSFAALFTNAGEASIAGLEVELSAVLSEAFAIDAQLGYMDAQYDEYIGPGGNDISSQREMVNTPEWTGRLAPEYTFNFANAGQLIVSADWSYRSKVYATVSSSEVLAQDSYSTVNAGISYYSADERWRISLSGKNLTDKEYLSHGFDLSDSLGYQLGYYGAPRTYSLTVGYSL